MLKIKKNYLMSALLILVVSIQTQSYFVEYNSLGEAPPREIVLPY